MPEINTGDTAWVLVSAALVLLMTPGLALFYGGMVRKKNVVGTLMQSFIVIALIGVQWVLYGYSLAFGPDHGGIIGGLDWLGLRGVGLAPNPAYAPTIPHQAFMVFQCMFAVITPALITGAFAERMKFKTFLVFILLWATLVYDPIACWVWNSGGWLRKLGALDFAGGAVVHISSGVSALAAAVVLGKRLGYGREPMEAHNVSMTVLGAGLLWFGWFGFNAGSALSAGAVATSAFVVTNTAGAMGALAWMFTAWAMTGKASLLGAVTGAVVGLAAVTPAAGFVGPAGALDIGGVAGVLCYLAVRFRNGRNVDDSLDVWACHGIGGTWGALATGIFAIAAINPAGADGLLAGNARQLAVQALAVAVVWVYAFVITWVILKVLDRVMGVRVSPVEELVGLDLSQHSEAGYRL